MNVIIRRNQLNGLLVMASGRLDIDNAVEYGTKIKDTIEDSDETITEVILDFAEITFISSFGLRIILELYKQLKTQDGTLKLRNVSEQIKNSYYGYYNACIFNVCIYLSHSNFPNENKTAYGAKLRSIN